MTQSKQKRRPGAPTLVPDRVETKIGLTREVFDALPRPRSKYMREAVEAALRARREEEIVKAAGVAPHELGGFRYFIHRWTSTNSMSAVLKADPRDLVVMYEELSD